MPDLNIKIGGYDFQMACSPGEEAALESAANLLDQEAKKLSSNNQKLSESKMLLIISLIMADEVINQAKNSKTSINSNSSSSISEESFNRLTELITQAEVIASDIEEKIY